LSKLVSPRPLHGPRNLSHFLCATSGSLCLCGSLFLRKITTEAQRTQRLH
jgi:hypothetical protein